MTAGAGINSITLVDIDQDGKLDVIMPPGNNGNNFIEIDRNTSSVGSTSFAGVVTFATTTSGTTVPFSTSIGDIDGDGKPDVVTSNGGANTVSVLRNTSSSGSISLAAHVDFSTGAGTTPKYVAVADLDGDGLPDIVIADNAAAKMSVLRNDPLHPITGTTSLCTGANTTLSNATPGGSWVSGNSGVATVGSSTGIVTGVSVGSATISYIGTAGSSFAGNVTTINVTVGSGTSTITNNVPFPANAALPLSDATAGGTWTSATPSVATVGSATGIVSGVSAGNSVIAYTVSGCAVTATVTVNAPSATNIWYSATSGGDASLLTNWWSNNNNTGYQPTLFSGSGDTWNFQSAMTSTAALTFGGNVSIVSGGTFTPLAASNTTIGGNFTQAAGGNFVPNSGTVILNGTSGTITAASMTTPTTNCFNNLSFNAASATTYTIASNLLLMGNFTNLTANATINLGATTLTIGGNWANPGPFTTGAGHQIIYNGTSGPVTITGNQ